MKNVIKVVIVDDEKLQRNLLRKCINWKDFNMEIIAEAANAEEALQILESNTVDILITDIHMPVMDGIQLISIAAKKYPETKFVVLTGYDYFSYAQKSVKLGVSDFLVKPINDEDVFKTLSNLKSIIDQEREEQEEYKRLRKQLYDNLPYLKERFLCELITGGIDNKKSIKEKLFFLNVHFKYNSFQVAALKLNHNQKENEELKYINSIKVINLVKMFFADNQHVYTFFDSVNRIIILNNDENLDLLENCELLRDRIAEDLNCSVCIGLGNLKINIEEISTSYREALEALDYRIAIGNNAVILYNDINFCVHEKQMDLTELYNKLILYLKSGLKDKAKEIIESIIDNSMDLKNTSSMHRVRDAAIDIILIFLKYSRCIELDEENQFKSEIQSLRQIFTIDTVPQIKEYLFQMLEEKIIEMKQQRIKKIDQFIMDVKKYVDENFSDNNLSLANIAKTFYVNPSYLSRTFKQETGINFIEYLTTVRMEKALKILKDKEDIKVYEIADAVGMSNPNYFSTCFKKYTGMSVSEYKSKLIDKHKDLRLSLDSIINNIS